MANRMTTIGLTALLALTPAALIAQAATAPPAAPDPLVTSVQVAAAHVTKMFAQAAEQMSEEDYAFKPTPEVRSFGQLLGHVAETNYWFCSSAMGEKAPVSDIEKTKTTKADIQRTLRESFAYCDRAYAAMSDRAQANMMRQFHGNPFPAVALLNFRTYHSLLHWGNAITYMRLRGKVPPSA